MEVTIEVKENIVEAIPEVTKRNWFANTVTVIKKGIPASHTYDVQLYLTPTEEERAIIFKYQLAGLIVEEVPTDPHAVEYYRQKLSEATDDLNRGVLRDMLKKAEESKTIYRFENYFNNPFVRSFDNPRAAHAYVDELKEKWLPLIKSNIDHYGSRTEKQSFSL